MKSNIMFKGDTGKDICIEDASIAKALSLLKSKQNGVLATICIQLINTLNGKECEQLNLDEL